MMETIIFAILASLVILPAILVVTMKNVFHSALWLILSMVGVAGVYAMLAADFLFAVQLLVYAGGIMVVLLFVILLSGRPSDWAGIQVNDKALGAALFSIFFVVIVVSTLSRWPFAVAPIVAQPSTAPIGDLLMGKMVLPLEVISLVLVSALVGALYFSSKKVTS